MIPAVSPNCLSGQKPKAQTSAPQPAPIDAVPGIVKAFKLHPIVIIGERHWLRQAGDFYIKLVQDPSFYATVRNIVVEFASRQNQPLLDNYVAGESVPIEQLRTIWRDTTKVGSWESPIYAEWLAAIREVNRKLPADYRLRVLAGDTSVDWNRIQTHADWIALGDNNISIAEVIRNQVLKKNQRALVVLGSNHIIKSGDRNGGPNVTTRLEAEYRGSTYVVLTLNARTFDPFIEAQLDLPKPEGATLYGLEGTAAAGLRDQMGTPLIARADALLYLVARGKFTELSYPPTSFEPAYVRELDRRSMIEWGELRIRKVLGLPPQ